MTDTARLSIKTETDQVKIAKQRLKQLEEQGERTELATKNLITAFNRTKISSNSLATSFNRTRRASDGLQESLTASRTDTREFGKTIKATQLATDKLRNSFAKMDATVDRLNASLNDVTVSSRRSNSQLDRGVRSVNRYDAAVRRANTTTGGFVSTLFSVQGAIAGLGLGLATRQVSNYADEWINATNRLKLATETEEELARAQQDSFDIAQKTRAGLTETVQLYSKIQLTAGDLIKDQEDLARIVETINKAVAVSGVSAESANAAIIQLTQGFSGGVLRGQEFNSVIEQTPRLATLIADGIGVARSEIRSLAMDGALTSDVVIAALRSQARVIDGEFNDTIINVSQSWTYLNNVLIRATGNLDDVTGGSRKASDAIIGFARAIDGLAGDTETLNTVLENTRSVLTALIALVAGRYIAGVTAAIATSSAFAAVLRAVGLASSGAAIQTNALGQVIGRTTALSVAATGAVTGLRTALGFLGGPVGVAIIAATALYEFGRRAEAAEKRAFDLATDVDTLTVSFRKLTQAQRANRVTELNKQFSEVRQEMIEVRKQIEEANKTANNSDFGIARVGVLESKYAKLQETLKILGAEQEALFKAGAPAEKDFVDALATEPDKVPLGGTTDDKEAERERKRKAREEKRLMDIQLRQAKARADEFEDLRQSLRSEEEVIGQSYDRRYQMILDNTRFFGAAQRDLLDRLNDQFATDVLEGFGSPTQSADRFDKEIEQLQEQFEARRQLILENTQLTEEQRTELELELTRRRNEQLQELENAKNELTLKNTKDILGGLLSLTKTFGGESTALYRTLFAASKAFAIADATVKGVQAVQKAFAEVPYPANFAAAAAAGVSAAANVATIASTSYAGAFDKGGDIPAGKFGLVGEFGPELVEGPMTVRSRRETADAFREASNDGQAPQQQGNNITLVNVVDPSVVDDYLNTEAGSEVIMNTIRNNPEVIKAVSNS